MVRRVIFAILLVIMIIVIGPFLNNLKGKELCPENYSYVEGKCCPDNNKDNVCDEKEVQVEEPKPVEVAEEVQPGPRTVIVEIFDMKFHPEELNINVGDTVVWVNKEERTTHKIYETFNVFRSQVMRSEEKYNFTFTRAGDYVYRDVEFKYMVGKVNVAQGTQITGSAVKFSSAKIRPIASVLLVIILIAINVIVYKKRH